MRYANTLKELEELELLRHNTGLLGPALRARFVSPQYRDKTYLEELGIGSESCADQFCKAIEDYLASFITWEECTNIMGAKRLLSSDNQDIPPINIGTPGNTECLRIAKRLSPWRPARSFEAVAEDHYQAWGWIHQETIVVQG